MYLAGYHYRHREVREALGAWAEAAQVMQEYVTGAASLATFSMHLTHYCSVSTVFLIAISAFDPHK